MMNVPGQRRYKPSSPTRPRLDEDGDTLIEVLLALVVMGITVLAILAAFMTSLSSSSTLRTMSINDSMLRTVSEQVIAQFQQGTVYQPCPASSSTSLVADYTSALSSALTIPTPYSTTGYSAAITAVNYWNGADFSSTCTAGSTVPEQLTVTVTGPNNLSVSSTFTVEGTGQIFSTPGIQLNPPTNVVLTAPSGSSGSLTVTFTGSSNAPTSPTQYYSAKACVNQAMSAGCSQVNSILSGYTLTGLIVDTQYWVVVWANASPGYLASAPTSPVSQTTLGNTSVPIITSVSPSTTTAGALVVTFTPPSNAPTGETYTATACSGSTMSPTGCPQEDPFSSGQAFINLTPGAPYTVTITANANTNANGTTYPASTSEPFGPTTTTAAWSPPTITSVMSSTLDPGAIVVYFSDNPPNSWPSNQTPTYTALACTNASMTTGCVSVSPYVSGYQFTGLAQTSPPTNYYVTVTVNASPGFLPATSSVYTPPVPASVALAPPTVAIKPKGASGTLTVDITPGSNAPRGVTYQLSVCPSTDPPTDTCVMASNITSNSGGGKTSYTVTGLSSGESYNVMAMENATSGYLASSWSAVVSGTAN